MVEMAKIVLTMKHAYSSCFENKILYNLRYNKIIRYNKYIYNYIYNGKISGSACSCGPKHVVRFRRNLPCDLPGEFSDGSFPAILEISQSNDVSFPDWWKLSKAWNYQMWRLPWTTRHFSKERHQADDVFTSPSRCINCYFVTLVMTNKRYNWMPRLGDGSLWKWWCIYHPLITWLVVCFASWKTVLSNFNVWMATAQSLNSRGTHWVVLCRGQVVQNWSSASKFNWGATLEPRISNKRSPWIGSLFLVIALEIIDWPKSLRHKEGQQLANWEAGNALPAAALGSAALLTRYLLKKVLMIARTSASIVNFPGSSSTSCPISLMLLCSVPSTKWDPAQWWHSQNHLWSHLAICIFTSKALFSHASPKPTKSLRSLASPIFVPRSRPLNWTKAVLTKPPNNIPWTSRLKDAKRDP